MRTPPFRSGTLAAPSGSSPSISLRASAASTASPRELSVLESRYPWVVRTLTLLWGHPELTGFLARVSTGLEPRLAHIEPAALAELMLLGELHRSICTRPHGKVEVPDSISRRGGAWRPAIHRG